MPHTTLTAQAIDDVLAGTFPASDPPGWTPGLARPAPEIGSQASEPEASKADTGNVEGVIHISRPPKRTFAQGLKSLAGAAGLSLLVPVVVLAAGLPLALGIRGLLELTAWFLALVPLTPGGF